MKGNQAAGLRKVQYPLPTHRKTKLFIFEVLPHLPRYVCCGQICLFTHLWSQGNRIRRGGTDKITWVMSEKILWSLVKRWESWRMLSTSLWVDLAAHLSPSLLFGASISFKEIAIWRILLLFVQCGGNVFISSENQVGTETWSDWMPWAVPVKQV